MSLTHAFVGMVIGAGASALLKFASKVFAVDSKPAEPISQAIKESIEETVIENVEKIEKKLKE